MAIEFAYRITGKAPYFVPLCGVCKCEIVNPWEANLEIDEHTSPPQSRIVCFACGREPTTGFKWSVWIRLSDACYELIKFPPRKRVYL